MRIGLPKRQRRRPANWLSKKTSYGERVAQALAPLFRSRISTMNSSKIASSVHFSSATDEWPTPSYLFKALDAEFGFTLDPAATHSNAKCAVHYTIKEDGLAQDWAGHTVFLNPPYGRQIGNWLKKAYESSLQGCLVAILVPSRTDTAWWHRYACQGEIRFLKGRIRFEGGAHCAPFPSAIVIFRPRPLKIVHIDQPGRK